MIATHKAGAYRSSLLAAGILLALAGTTLTGSVKATTDAAQPAAGAAVSAPETEPAQRALATWLDLVDSGQYGSSWEQAASDFRIAVKRADWEKGVAAVRAPLGAVVSRTLRSATHKTSLPGAPDGEYVVVQNETAFENAASTIETGTMKKESSGEWRAIGYFVRPNVDTSAAEKALATGWRWSTRGSTRRAGRRRPPTSAQPSRPPTGCARSRLHARRWARSSRAGRSPRWRRTTPRGTRRPLRARADRGPVREEGLCRRELYTAAGGRRGMARGRILHPLNAGLSVRSQVPGGLGDTRAAGPTGRAHATKLTGSHGPDPELLHHRPHRPRQVDPRRPPDPALRGGGGRGSSATRSSTPWTSSASAGSRSRPTPSPCPTPPRTGEPTS